ncbi:hypothetical protein Val02_50750 [Virgisporangium aliadipatigenens]|uniref:Uncharacterized protein n=1 Tax=Virgisporangium aliadipatigenens TaxID=741659 RepID=A0A8J4DRZ5_9ACTN|nr:hypothetical protein [Virgisporangium aliadipatigenens]GIJ48189.1 hypothetical protein Val02_50750 [Virgisporangium aliadipatigenens]
MRALSTETLDAVMTAMANVPVPKPKPELGGTNLDTTARKLLGLLRWAGMASGVFGILVSGTMMSLQYKEGQNQEHVGRLGMVLAGCVIIATAAYLVGFVVGEPVG